MACKERLELYLREHGVAFQLEHHRTAYTAQELAQAEHIPGRMVAKSIIGLADGKMVMLVLPSTHVVDRAATATAVAARGFQLADEQDFGWVFADCEVGAIPPFGNLYGLPVYVDRSLAADDEIVFPAGSHTETLKIRYDDFVRLVQPVTADCARPRFAYTSQEPMLDERPGL
jgi:Ala-tRNA(Pro) deacylase